MDNKYLTVSALNKYLYYKFDTDLNLRNVYLKAEISNVRLSKGIYYFVLKDEEAEIDALMFQGTYSKLKFVIEDGMRVLVCGKVGIYTKRGTYAITVVNIEEIGLGECHLQFLKLKEKLLKEGLFDDEHKLPIPTISEKIGVITSSTGDAMHDIFSTIEKRFPLSEVVFYPAIVQGQDAPRSIISALKKANDEKIVDVIIIARGGGTIEDLSCFNDETLARTIFSSRIPTISGVGHEADFTICDFVASRRAPTPTGAAVIATPTKEDMFNKIDNFEARLNQKFNECLMKLEYKYNNIKSKQIFSEFYKTIDVKILEINNIIKRLNILSPHKQIVMADEQLDNLCKVLIKSFIGNIETLNNTIKNNITKLIVLNPLNLMSKGYTIATQDDKVISSINDLNLSKDLNIKFHDGEVIAKIKEKTLK